MNRLIILSMRFVLTLITVSAVQVLCVDRHLALLARVYFKSFYFVPALKITYLTTL